MPQKIKFLGFGINSYRNAPLQGCLNDIVDMRDTLKKHGLKKKPTDCVILLEGNAKKANVVAKMTEMVTGLKAGERLYIHGSTHGTQMPNKPDRKEADGLDEGICLWKFDWTDKTFLSDNNIYDILKQTPVDAEVIFSMDCCNSGDIGKDLLNRKKRIPLISDLLDWITGKEEEKGEKIVSPVSKLKILDYDLPNVVILSACSTTESAIDGMYYHRANGKFTRSLITIINANPYVNCDELIYNLQQECKGIQTPQLQCIESIRNMKFIVP